ncbi:hypothetical protein [Frigoriflavimonas asaccharolytica]|uniref:Uncharacterized protein n=1 Tax=Frigoriflavimonas asaccharolytica TaxID=2735899 RepID=A0A8J8G9V7_9FLAO|nr:hypothetical protein [Frigoriflavimonas asaccharolytica]NRS91642.1 hypothetical protein [Frigoriflavimonas asaccharolytica]
MKNFKKLFVAVLLFCSFFAIANDLKITDPTYYLEFKKNEQPENVEFKSIKQNELVKKGKDIISNYNLIKKTISLVLHTQMQILL